MAKSRNTQPDPALDLLYKLRTESYQSQSCKTLLATTQVQLLQYETPWRPSVQEVLSWLATLKDADTTLHNKLDQIIPFLETVGGGNLRDTLKDKERKYLVPIAKLNGQNLTNYSATLKSL